MSLRWINKNATTEVIDNSLCSCKFGYHQLCYEKWINLVREKQCLICRNDISMNFLYTIPFDASRNRITTQRRPPFVNIALMSPRSRYRYGIPFSYRPRRVTFCDRILNTISCEDDPNIQNPLVDWIDHNSDLILMTLLTICCFTSIIVMVMIFTYS